MEKKINEIVLFETKDKLVTLQILKEELDKSTVALFATVQNEGNLLKV